MKIVIAPDSFYKYTSIEVSNIIEKGIKKIFKNADIVKIPITDGGKGTVDALLASIDGEKIITEVTDPFGNKRMAEYVMLNSKTAVMEMASASGLILPSTLKYNSCITTTYGTGELIKNALSQDCKKIIICNGESSANDGGIGMAQALGVSFKDKSGRELGFGGGELGKLCYIDISGLDKRIINCEIIATCNDSTHLCGTKGISAIYGQQKGVSCDDIRILDDNLAHYAKIIRQQLGKDVAGYPGAGLGGGLGAGLIAFCNAKLKSGVETVLDTINIQQFLDDCDLVITGESKVNSQSIYGKVPVCVALRAKKNNIPVLVIAGEIGIGALKVYNYGIDGIINTFNKKVLLNEEFLLDATERAMKIVKIGMELKN